jgi:phage terminase large subunit-like protein
LFKPYEKQQIFFELGKRYKTRTLSGGNRTGKTTSFYRGELAFHLTGEYPDWWNGHRFDGPIRTWVGSTDWKTNIKGCQLALVGDVLTGNEGRAEVDPITGELIPCGLPKDTILRMDKMHQVKGALSGVEVRHVSGGKSFVTFIAYSQSRENLQAGKVQIVGMDEEPPLDIYTELVTRTMDSGGLQVLTFTPLKGLSEVVKQQIGDISIDENFPDVVKNDAGALVRISMHDAPHLSSKMIEHYKATIPKHEHMARIEGIPALGEGAIYPIDDDKITTEYFNVDRIPPHWWVCDGIDIGINHPTARARVYRDPDSDTFYLTQCYKVSDLTTKVHAANWRDEFKGNVPIVWPHDARNRQEGLDGDTLESVVDKYRNHGLNMTYDPVTMPNGTRLSAEGAIQIMMELMTNGRFKVMDGISGGTNMFLSEKGLYRREKSANGKLRIIGQFDDVLHATRNAVLALLSGEGKRVGSAFGKHAERKAKTKEKAYQMGKPLSAIRDDWDDEDDCDYSWEPGQI